MSTSSASAAATATAPAHLRPAYLGAAGLVALVLNGLAYLIGDSAGAAWDVGQPYALSLAAVLATTVVVFAIGGLVVWFVSSRRPGFVRFAAWAGLAVGLLSMLSLLNATDLATALALGSMHVITAVAWVLALIGPRHR